MVRHRGGGKSLQDQGGNTDDDSCPNNPNRGSSRILRKPPMSKKGSSGSSSSWLCSSNCLIFLAGCTAIAICVVLGYWGYKETRIATPLSAPRVMEKTGLAVPERFWGSYRSGLYFGMKTRSPKDLLTGLMWFIPGQISNNNLGLRHWCDQNDNLDSYGWVAHDGENFGIQEIKDRGLKLTTSFVKRLSGSHGGDWTARIKVEALQDTKSKKKAVDQGVTLFYYAGLDDGANGDFAPKISHVDPNHMTGLTGSTDGLGSFKIDFVDRGKQISRHFYAETHSAGPQDFTDSMMKKLRMYQEQKIIGLDRKNTNPGSKSNLVIYQVNAATPFELDVVFESGSSDQLRKGPLVAESYTESLESWRQKFDERFEDTFELEKKGFQTNEISFAKAALSNMVGGIGYFYGQSLVKSDLNSAPVNYWEAPLYSAVPSRSFFPRGFLWDEGFHNLLISKWDKVISAEILGHWMDLINIEGWIPREQILGLEARAKVPAEFVVQHNKNANPPTLLLTLHSMVKDSSLGWDTTGPWFKEYLQRMWPRLEAWYNWFSETQQGEVPGTFRWRGRNGTTNRELNPKTLTSGLDDFPRASHPTEDERHVDLRCWMALASKLMADIAKIIGREEAAAKYSTTAAFLHDNELLDNSHWSDEHKAYLDFGLHSEGVRLRRPIMQNPRPGMPQPDKIREVYKEPHFQYVNQFGYISLFPFLLQIVSPSSPKLPILLSDISDPKKLFTPFGLRSLSSSATLYMARNTEHDPPYWRGPIWININFLAVRALNFYANAEGPHQEQAKSVYDKLRKAVVGNVIKEYERTGYIWEQYNDKTGEGQGCRPFTGWSALTVLMMGETY